MSVYVEPCMFHGWVLRGKPVKSCHLQGDSEEELLAFGAKIGLKPSWLQRKGDPIDAHFDLTEGKRAQAVAAGAIEQSRLEFVNRRRRLRGQEPIPDVFAGKEEAQP